MGSGAAPCGACKFLRRKCVKGCIFAPYFCSEELGAAHFGAIHKVFGASNFSKLLMHIPVEDRYDAVVSVSYEAQARLHDPIYGCVSHIFALQHQVASLQAKLNVAHAQLATSSLDAGPGTVSGSYGIGGGGGPGPRQQRSDISCSSSTSGSPYDQQRHFFPSQSMYGGASASVAGGCENIEEGSSLPMDYSHSHSSSTSTSTTDLFGQEPMADEGDLQAFALALLRRKH